MKEALKTVKIEFPDKAIDILESLQLLQETISSTMEDINDKINEAFNNRDFNSVQMYSKLAKETHSYEEKLEGIIDFIDVEIDDMILGNETDEETEKRIIPNYADYLVDHNIEHTLHENLTHKRPYAFKVSNYQKIEVNTWRDMFIKTCELLLAVDEDKFLSFENNERMNGKKNKYFSTDPSSMRDPKPVLDKIYVETNRNANGLRNTIVKLLKEYNFKVSEYKIYFRADYSEINR